jgi:hypothetical protein
VTAARDQDVVRRVFRDTILACVLMAVAAWLWQPFRPRLALGVLGGGGLIALAFWALRGMVDGLMPGDESGGNVRVSGAFVLVKIFTRHAILALAAYGMMVRFEFEPVGMLIGVSAVVVAAAVEATRRN